MTIPAHPKSVGPDKAHLAPINPAHQDSKPQVDALLLAYMYMFESVQTEHRSARIQAKGLEANASAQNQMIGQEAMLNFSNLNQNQLFTVKKIRDRHSSWRVIGKVPIDHVWYTTRIVRDPKEVAQTVLQQFETHNQEISADRGIIENQITVLRQDAQVSQTNLNSSINEDQQTVQQGASLMQMLTQLTNQISRI